MKKLILSFVGILGIAATTSATVLAQYDFTGNSLTSSAVVPGATDSGISKNGLVNSSAINNQFVFDTSDIGGTLNTSQNYIKFTVTAGTGYQINLSTLTFNLTGQQNGGHPVSYAVYASYNGGTLTALGTYRDLTSSQAETITFSTPFTTALTAGQHVDFQIYAYGGNGKSGGIDDIVLNGDVTPVNPVPEPVNVALVLFGCTFAGVGAGRKFLKKKA